MTSLILGKGKFGKPNKISKNKVTLNVFVCPMFKNLIII